MNLKNYTSDVPASRTIARIEEVLAHAGADGVAKVFKNGRVESLSFHANLPNGKTITIRLPANVESVYTALRKNISKPRAGTEQRLMEQAERTAWKLMQDWTEVQMSLIAMNQAEFLQVFLPYIHDGKESFYARLKGSNFAALPAPKDQ